MRATDAPWKTWETHGTGTGTANEPIPAVTGGPRETVTSISDPNPPSGDDNSDTDGGLALLAHWDVY
jgi:hypothetical protein